MDSDERLAPGSTPSFSFHRNELHVSLNTKPSSIQASHEFHAIKPMVYVTEGIMVDGVEGGEREWG